jgi:very-short-patch-repair endonuclease
MRERSCRPSGAACVELRLVVEVDGGQHAESEYDAWRTTRLESEGWHVIRFWNTSAPAIILIP